jgi:hypothetical protein
MEPRKTSVPGADTVLKVEGNMYRRESASVRTTRRGALLCGGRLGTRPSKESVDDYACLE